MKRCGLAVTDPLQIAVHGLPTVEKKELYDFVIGYCRDEEVEKIVFGHPELFTDKLTPVVQSLNDFVARVKKDLPDLVIEFHDESYSSQKASELIHSSGVGRKKRRDKTLVDKISAVLILQDYLGHI